MRTTTAHNVGSHGTLYRSIHRSSVARAT